MKFQPGQVVHVVEDEYSVVSAVLSKVRSYNRGITRYFIGDDEYFECDLHATFENAMAELKRQNGEGK